MAIIYLRIKTLIFCMTLFATLITLAVGCTRVGFYETTCPRAEDIVHYAVQSAVRSNQSFAPGLLRMFFHDCFVNGCDASILLNGASSEQTSRSNSHLRGFEVIHAAKSMIEKECPGVVSCADILALAARDSVVLSGGIGWAVPTGRRDGLVSLASEADKLPGSKESVDVQIEKFANKGLDIEDLVTLVGGHTIGTSSCARFVPRLYNYQGTHKPDPKIDQAFLPHLQALCPHGGDESTRVDLDTGSANIFDNSYYENLRSGRGVLESDSNLWTDPRTQRLAEMFVGVSGRPRLTLSEKFGRAMVKLSNVEVKTGDQGEIRRMCSYVN